MPAYFVNIADLVDPNDPGRRTYREINAARTHAIPVGALVEIDNGARLFVVKHTRDCDQEPLYSLAADPLEDQDPDIGHYKWSNGYGEDGMTVIRQPTASSSAG